MIGEITLPPESLAKITLWSFSQRINLISRSSSRTPFYKSTSGGLLLNFKIFQLQTQRWNLRYWCLLMIMKFTYLYKYHLIITNSGSLSDFTKNNKLFNKINVTAPYLTKTNKINHLEKISTINCLRKYKFVVPEV